VNKQPLAESLLELLLAGLARTSTKDQLGPELPLKWDAPVLGSLLVNDGVVVLQVCAEALSLKSNPERVLVHGVGVLGPVAEVVGVKGELLAQVLNGLGGFVEEHLKGLLVGVALLLTSTCRLWKHREGGGGWWGLHHACFVGPS
jgi:hypothetical protein